MMAIVLAIVAHVASSTSTIYENISKTQFSNHLEDLKMEDSGTYDAESRNNSNETITSYSPSPELSSSHHYDEKHIYTNIFEMNELNNRPFSAVPDVTDVPRRKLNIGWKECETEAGRTYSHNSKTEKSQCIPSRFIRTPAQVQVIRFLVQNRLVDCLVTTGGGVVEDLIKCMKPSYCDDFHMDGKELLSKGLKRDGNILTPHYNYALFDTFMDPIIEECVKKQDSGFNWTPSKFCEMLGQKIDHEESILYWAARNKIPVFCPSFTDGFFGDMLFLWAVMAMKKLRIDVVDDLGKINCLALTSHRTGVLVLGGGVVKDYTDSANRMRGGSDFAVYIGTDTDDGPVYNASTDDAVSWRKINPAAHAVKVCADATIVFPLLVAETFAKRVHKEDEEDEEDEEE